MKCLSCDKKMIQGGTHTMEECGFEEEGFIHNFSCSYCDSHALFYEVVKSNA